MIFPGITEFLFDVFFLVMARIVSRYARGLKAAFIAQGSGRSEAAQANRPILYNQVLQNERAHFPQSWTPKKQPSNLSFTPCQKFARLLRGGTKSGKENDLLVQINLF
jgi:hypothetical protein